MEKHLTLSTDCGSKYPSSGCSLREELRVAAMQSTLTL